MIARLGRIQVRNANRAGNALTVLLGAVHGLGVSTLLPIPMPAPGPFLIVVCFLGWLGWQARLSRRLLSSL